MPGIVTLKDLIDGTRGHLAAFPVKDTLDGAINDSIGSIQVTNSDAFEFVGSRTLIEIDDEILLGVAISGSTVTVLRGYEGSAKASHADGAEIKIHPSWGWTDRTLRWNHIPDAIRWLKPSAWVQGVSETFIWEKDEYDVQIPASCLVDFPFGNYPIEVERRTMDGKYIPFSGWKPMGRFLRFKERAGQDHTLHILYAHFQRPLNNLLDTLDNDDFKEAIETYAASLALNQLKTNRVRFAEYSASLNDRSSTPDELIRMAFDLKNQAIVARENFARQLPSGYLSTYRDPR